MVKTFEGFGCTRDRSRLRRPSVAVEVVREMHNRITADTLHMHAAKNVHMNAANNAHSANCSADVSLTIPVRPDIASWIGTAAMGLWNLFSHYYRYEEDNS